MSEKSLADIVNQVQSQARYFQAVLDLAAAVDDVNKIDQLRSEADARLAAKADEEAKVAARLDNLMAQVDAASGKVALASGDADRILEAAMRQAGQMKRDAEDVQRKIIDAARVEADGIGRDARLEAKNARDALAGLKAETDEATAMLDATKAELATVSKQLSDAKAAIAALLKV